MIIRFSKEETAELEALDEYYEEKQSELFDQMITESVSDPVEIRNALNRIQEEQAKARDAKYREFEDARFEKIKYSQTMIFRRAQSQTNEAIKRLQVLVDSYKPNSTPEKKQQDIIRKMLGKPKTEKQLLLSITPLPPIFYGLIDDIIQTKGDISKLDSQKVISTIQKDLYRHYGKLDDQKRKDLTEYITQSVNEVIIKPKSTRPEKQRYLPVTKDAVFNTFPQAVVKKKKDAEHYDGESSITINNVTFTIKPESRAGIAEEIIKHLGISAFTLLVLVNSKFTEHPSMNNREFLFPIIPFLELGGHDTSNPEAIRKAINRFKREDLTALNSMIVTIAKRSKKSEKEDLILDQHVLSNTGFTNDKTKIAVTLDSDYAEFLINTRTKGYFPQSFFLGNKQNLNAFMIKIKLWDNATMYENINSGQSEKIGIKSLIKVTNLPAYEKLGRKRSLWRELIRDRIESYLNEAMKSGEFTGWEYISRGTGILTPQERVNAERDYYSWENLLVTYKLKNVELRQKLIEDAKEYKEKKEKEASEKKQTEAEPKKKKARNTQKKKVQNSCS